MMVGNVEIVHQGIGRIGQLRWEIAKLVLASVPAVGEICGDGLLPRLLRRVDAAYGAFEAAQDVEGLPWLGDVPVRFAAGEGTLDLRARFVVAMKVNENESGVTSCPAFLQVVS